MLSTALLLAGGFGKRLRPITYEIPKCMLPVHGKPILEWLIDMLKAHGVRHIIISLGWLADYIKEYFTDKDFDVEISFVQESQPLGTAGPLLLAKDMLSDTFIVSNGDELKKLDITAMQEFHRKNNAATTIALVEVENPSNYGVAKLSGNKIIEFIEKPKNPPTNLINSGFYIMEPEILDLIKPGFCMLERDVFPVLANQGKLFGFPFKGQWFDCGTFERYAEALKCWK